VHDCQAAGAEGQATRYRIALATDALQLTLPIQLGPFDAQRQNPQFSASKGAPLHLNVHGSQDEGQFHHSMRHVSVTTATDLKPLELI
jgi:hypothetical protein